MKQTSKTYLGLGLVFVASVAAALLLPIDAVFKGIASTPAIVALIGALYQILREQAAFEKQRYLQRQEQFFNLGVTSHMANTAFDKHVEFCEKYMKEVHSTVATLFRHGPTKEAFENVGHFIELRREYAAWVPRDVGLQLEPFENALSRMSTQMGLADDLIGDGQSHDVRVKAIHEAHSIFKKVLQIGKEDPSNENSVVSVEVIKERIRSILGIEELTRIREKLIRQALQLLEKDA
jgi:hypothetical protein